MNDTSLRLDMPPWIEAAIDRTRRYASDEEQVELAIALSRINIGHQDGGPFGAVVFDEDGLVVAVGVNRVMALNTSLAHAEIMALLAAQARLNRPRLNADGRRYTLASSAQPCCQCYGASFWAGIDRLLFAASAGDVMELTDFNEGPLPADWAGELARIGIEVKQGIMRDKARAVLADYQSRGGPRY